MNGTNKEFIKRVSEIWDIMYAKGLTRNAVAVELKISPTGVRNYLGNYKYQISPNMKAFMKFYNAFMKKFK